MTLFSVYAFFGLLHYFTAGLEYILVIYLKQTTEKEEIRSQAILIGVDTISFASYYAFSYLNYKLFL